MNKVFLHVDLDAFFASVEQLDHPEYRGKPVIVGGLPGDRRSVVSTASYEARRFGVHSAMPTYQAVKLCPQGIFVRGRMKRYHEKSEEVMAIFKEYSPDIQQISVDEAFIDLTGTERLFGDPVQTARKLKEEVREKTGLTVSVGLASTKYCAKIASGLQKPDGLTVVPFGKETDFMLSLPIEKVWGAGSKTLQKLRNYGIKTPRDIYTRSESLLKSLFGNAAGTFLYNAVRGNPGADFHAEPKSRSISAETTYDYDLTSPEIIETALLSLCHTVMFRSLREKVRSSTVSIKIRYEDFTTVSVQSTSERYVSSIDDLFERAKSLLEKKRDSHLGIRLLGVAMQNLEDETSPRQQELFDFGEEKKRKLENAILKAQEKNPSLKITKARLLGTSSLILAILAFPLQKTAASPSSFTEREADGAAGIVFDTSKLPLADSSGLVSLFNTDFANQNVEFFAEGYWKSTVTSSAAYSFGFGTTPTLSTSSPVFAQNVDLSLYFMLNHHWYFEAAFADEFAKNTVAAGYVGEGYLKSARLSNRNIVFPDFYSVNEINRGIGGGENQAPGICLNWAGENWQADAALRYDLIESHEKSWYGKNSVTINEIALSSFNTGNQYILPKAELVKNVKAVYVESANGTYKDSKGRKYKKLDESQYLLLASERQILLSKDARAFRQNGSLPCVALTFWTVVNPDDFGSYDDETTFLGKIQKWFNQGQNKTLKLEKFSYQISGSIEGEDCLFVQHSGGFSPFSSAYRYDCGTSSATDAQVAFFGSGTADADYSVVIDEDRLSFAQSDFFYSNHLYADIYLSEDNTEDEIEKLIHSSFPMAAENPQIYLGSSSSSLCDKVLQVRSFSPVNRFEIGTNAVAGGITVYKNGVIDAGAKYDPESGTITLSSSVTSTDHITARWYEESEDSESGSVAWGTGFKYDFSENLSGNISSSGRWAYSGEQAFADATNAQSGFASLAGNFTYAGENFGLKNTIAASYENKNTSGLFRILGCDDIKSETAYLSKKAAVDLPAGFCPTLNIKTSGEIKQIELKSEKNGSIEAKQGISDSEISGYAIPLEWDFSGMEAGTEENLLWAAISLYTPALSPQIMNVSTFSIALKNSDFDNTFDDSKTALYLQLGVSSDDDFDVEESQKIPTWKISDSGACQIQKHFIFSKAGWQTVTVTISDEDRSAISSLQNFNARLIIATNDEGAMPHSGTIYAGPYEAGELTFLCSTEADVLCSNYELKDSSLSSEKIKKFNKSGISSANYVQYFDWHFNSEPLADEEIKFTRYFSEIDLSEYKKLSFFMKAENAESITITLARTKSGQNDEKSIVYEIENPSSNWNEFTIDLTRGKTSKLSVLDTDILPTKLEISVKTRQNGSLSFDELHLSENTPFLTMQDKIETSYKRDGNIIESNSRAILKDFRVNAAGNASGSIETENGTSKGNSIQSTGTMGFTLTNLKFSGSAKISNAYLNVKSSDVNQTSPLDSANHSIQSEKPFFGLLSFAENYNFSAAEESLEKTNSAKIDFSSLSVPLEIAAETKATSDSWALASKAKGSANFSAGRFKFESSAKAEQKIPVSASSSVNASRKEKFETENYASSWKKITEFSFDTGSSKASRRSIEGKADALWQFDKFNFAPKVFIDCTGDYKSASKVTFTDSTKAGLELPFTIPKNNFSFSWKKTGGSTQSSEKGGNYGTDAEELQKSLSEKSYFLYAMPIYDLLSTNLSEKIFETGRNSNFYTGSYTLNWKRAFFANKYDFFIPNSAKLEATRDIRTGENTTDFYQLKSTVHHTALNIFGKTGTVPLFAFFSNDEYNSSFSAAVKIPRTSPCSFSYLLNTYLQATLYFSSQNYLKNGFEGTLEGKTDWKAKYTIIWKRNASSSLAKGFVELFIKEDSRKQNRIRKADSLNISASSTSPSSSSSSPTRKYNVDYTHTTETQVNKYIFLNSDVGFSYYANWGKSATLTANASLGATIKF
ncbi:DNA polymerase IV [uncultured Treponema sp.]|uniref:DNA polymerase IV n=1 Tax=uncultured Treponema sp. TaxID=162155 RepID=UPI0025E90CCC|nr:DNA polymerase IV [uncultured Treponema sp.]